jgi:hypothetical protein
MSLVCLLFVLRVGARDAGGAVAALVHKHEGALTHEWAVVFALLHRLSVADGTDAHLRATSWPRRRRRAPTRSAATTPA